MPAFGLISPDKKSTVIKNKDKYVLLTTDAAFHYKDLFKPGNSTKPASTNFQASLTVHMLKLKWNKQTKNFPWASKKKAELLESEQSKNGSDSESSSESTSESPETESEEPLAIQEHHTDFGLGFHTADMRYAAKTVMERRLKLGKDNLKRLVGKQVQKPGMEKAIARGKYFKTCPLGSEPLERTQCLHHAQEKKNTKEHGTRLMDWLRTKMTCQDASQHPSTSSSPEIIIIDAADSITPSSASVRSQSASLSSSPGSLSHQMSIEEVEDEDEIVMHAWAQMWSLPDSVDAILMDVNDEILDMPVGALEVEVEDDKALAWGGLDLGDRENDGQTNPGGSCLGAGDP
ncbi:hypothetical protein EV421DRAFT_1915810 [Armillaria borealis]|uniref:Uncharacterized protein n=1 Tax=Armillaria borealis TaxID=47425 RepID=A0AA39IC49_9AGAR|nr:hypothetical protein EV421DRAFT_1915810 [Armillaria borealis]